METVIRQVWELGDAERSTIEHLVGHALRENQQLVIQVMTVDLQAPAPAGPTAGSLPAWSHVYDGLSDAEIADLERVVLDRADLSRFSQ